MLKTKIVSKPTMKGFQDALDKLLNSIGPGSVQYRPTYSSSNEVRHTALVIYEVPDDLEGNEEYEEQTIH